MVSANFVAASRSKKSAAKRRLIPAAILASGDLSLELMAASCFMVSG